MHRIEVLGIQGSGKTTLLGLTKEVLEKKGKNVFDHRDLMASFYRKKHSILNNFYFKATSKLFDFILLHLFLLRSIHKRFQIDFIKNNHRFFCYITSEHRKTVKDNEINSRVFEQVVMTYGYLNLAQKILDFSDILLLDEGISYRPISLFVSDDKILEYEQIKTYFELLPPPQVILYIKPNIEKSIERMETRGFPRRIENKSTAKKTQYLQNVERSLQIILTYLKNRDIYIFEIENEDDINYPKKLSAKLNKILDRYLNGLPATS